MAITQLPESFTPHKQLKKVYEARRAMIETGEGVDWGMAEALAFGTLLAEGNHVRLSGQARSLTRSRARARAPPPSPLPAARPPPRSAAATRALPPPPRPLAPF
jgi:hypothetical protein